MTKHCTTGKYEAHLWDPEKKRPPVSTHCLIMMLFTMMTALADTGLTCGSLQGSAREKGVQVYLGGWESEMHAALVYDIAYYKFWGHCAKTNVRSPFPICIYL